MDEVSIVGVDLVKQVFQLHGAEPDGRVIFRKELSRAQFARFMATCLRGLSISCCRARRWRTSRNISSGSKSAGLGMKRLVHIDSGEKRRWFE